MSSKEGLADLCGRDDRRTDRVKDVEAGKDVVDVEEDGDLLGEAVVGRPVPEDEAKGSGDGGSRQRAAVSPGMRPSRGREVGGREGTHAGTAMNGT